MADSYKHTKHQGNQKNEDPIIAGDIYAYHTNYACYMYVYTYFSFDQFSNNIIYFMTSKLWYDQTMYIIISHVTTVI